MSLFRRFLPRPTWLRKPAHRLYDAAGARQSGGAQPLAPQGAGSCPLGTGEPESAVVHRIQSTPQNPRMFVRRTSGGGSSSLSTVHQGLPDPAAAANPSSAVGRVLIRCLTGCLDLYKRFLSPLLPSACRFYPTCSVYMREAIVIHGSAKGVWLGLKRLSRCHPLHEGGCDPVPPARGPVPAVFSKSAPNVSAH